MRSRIALFLRQLIEFVQRRPALHATIRLVARPLARRVARFARQNLNVIYAKWLNRHFAISDADRALIRAEIAGWHDPPLISVVMPAYETRPDLLRAAIGSVVAQLYPHWELCIADDASPSPHVAQILAEVAAAEPRLRWVRRDSNGHISAASNSALALASGPWVALMDHDDILHETALYRLAREALAHPGAEIVYSDEDKIDAAGQPWGPYFKPDFDPDLLYGQNVISHLGCYRRELLQRIGGFRLGFEGSQDYDLALRAVRAAGPQAVRHIPAMLYHWRQGGEGESFSESQLQRCIDVARRSIAEALEAEGRGDSVVENPLVPVFNRVIRHLPDPAPLVSIIVPTRDRHELLAPCVEGILRRTDYPAIELIIVDNDSSDPETLALFGRLAADARVRILRSPGPFNYSRLNNLAAEAASGEVLLLLNNDTEVIEAGWLREMVSQAIRPGIGAVGAKLLYPDDTIQHAGVILGIGWPGGIAGHAYPGAPRTDPGAFGHLGLVRSVAAVTAACLAVRKSLYAQVGGLDEENLAVAFNDVDFCLRLMEAGYRNIWTPFAELYHKESASRGDDLVGRKAARFQAEVQYMRSRWGRLLDQDPYWNPSLSLLTQYRDLAHAPRDNALTPWRDAAPSPGA
jgi:GT2 family glycosyltransferase